MGNANGHTAAGVNSCREACEEIRAKGGKITFEPASLEGSNEVIAFTQDPDGHPIELIERSSIRELNE